MKILSGILGLGLLAWFTASAQVSVEVVMDQEQFLPSEAVPVAVKITNRSGQPLHLGAEANWLTFSVESKDGFVVIKNAEVPVAGEFDLGSSEGGDEAGGSGAVFRVVAHGALPGDRDGADQGVERGAGEPGKVF